VTAVIRSRLRGLRAACAMTLLAGLATGLAASPATAAPAAPAAARTAARAGQPAAAPALLTEEQAQEQAESTGEPVTATAASTPAMTTVANPDGSFTTSVSAQPVQAYVNGAWTALNADLQQNSGGSYSPAVSSEPLTLSGGANSVLATMTAADRTLSLSWPGTLPVPSVSGATATYANVFPGVNLVVTADDQGGFSDVLVVSSATAAANPALSSLQLTASTTGGLVLSTDASGDLIAAAGPSDPPLMSFDAPQIWDSTPPPATETTVTNGDGVTVDAASGDPVDSTIDGPGTGAQVATVPVSVSGDTITLTPPASVLTGSSTTYPVYIDPTWHNYAASNASAWTQVFSGYPTETSLFDKDEDLRVGVCPVDLAPDCNGIGVARSFIQMKIPPQLHESTVVHSAYLYMTEDWAPSCTAETVRLYPVSGGISRSTDWDNAPAMPDSGASYASQSAAFGYPGCGYYNDDITWDVTSTIAADAGEVSSQTWGLRADDESTSDVATSELYWKLFKGDASDFTLSVTYDDPPNQPTHLSTDPGGGCHTGQNDPAVIGNDDVTFFSYASDNSSDNNLSTAFSLYTPSGTSVFSATVTTGDNSMAQTTILRTAMQSYGTNGTTTAYEYYYQTQVTNDFGLTSPLSDKCWIYYNPNGPQEPTVSFSASSVTIGGSVTASFTSPGCSSTTNPCPTSYVYQVGAATPVTETANSSNAWSGSIQVNSIGPIEISVYGVVSGNPGETSTRQIVGTLPTTAYQDGYFTGGSYPDLLTVGTGADPSLWLSVGTGNGTVAPPVDIGSLGTGINPGTDGPADWKDAIVTHGNFTGHGVQDVMAYYTSGPHAGNGVIIDGNGDGNVKSLDLAPDGGRTSLVQAGLMQSPATGTTPTDLVGAGNVSGLSTGTDDLIGIAPDGGTNTAGNGELDLYTNGEGLDSAVSGDYGYYQTLTTTAPDGGTDWANYSIATAGNPSNTVLFALDTSTGIIYESASPLTLASGGTWTEIGTVAIGGTLVQGDINHAGQTELWVNEDGVLFSHTVSGTTLSGENSTDSIYPSDDWQLTDGNDAALGPTATTAVDSITGTNATITGGASWDSDSIFGTDANFNGTSRYLTPPSSTISGLPYYLSVWFKTTTAGGVLASVQGSALSSGSTATSGYNPLMYVGDNGLLYAEFWYGTASPFASTYKVDDGQWHHAVLSSVANEVCGISTGCSTFEQQTLTLDGAQQAVSPQGYAEDGNWGNLTFGAGYIGGTWPDEANYEQDGILQYFNGQMADIQLSDGSPPVVSCTGTGCAESG
jgi:hypothetical protein